MNLEDLQLILVLQVMNNLKFIEADYLIAKLGPNVNGRYEYTVVTVPSITFLWVLARDPKTYFEKYRDEVKDFIENDLKFNSFYNKYVERHYDGFLPYDDM